MAEELRYDEEVVFSLIIKYCGALLDKKNPAIISKPEDKDLHPAFFRKYCVMARSMECEYKYVKTDIQIGNCVVELLKHYSGNTLVIDAINTQIKVVYSNDECIYINSSIIPPSPVKISMEPFIPKYIVQGVPQSLVVAPQAGGKG